MIHALVFRVVDMGLDAQRILLDLDVALSHMIDQQQIGATLNDGVLTLTLKKVQQAQPRRIEIS